MSTIRVQTGKPNERLVSHVTGLAQLTVQSVLLKNEEIVQRLNDNERSTALDFGMCVLVDYGATLYKHLIEAFNNPSAERVLDWLKVSEIEAYSARETIWSRERNGASEALLEFGRAVIAEHGEMIHTVATARLHDQHDYLRVPVGYG